MRERDEEGSFYIEGFVEGEVVRSAREVFDTAGDHVDAHEKIVDNVGEVVSGEAVFFD